MAIVSIPSTIGGVTIPGTASTGPLGALFGNQYGSTSLQYPRDLGSMQKGHMVQFKIIKRTPGSFEGLANKLVDLRTNAMNVARNPGVNNLVALGNDVVAVGGAIAGTAEKVFMEKNTSVSTYTSPTDQIEQIINLYMPDTVSFSYNAGYTTTSTLGVMESIAGVIAKAGSSLPLGLGGLASIPSMAISAIQSNPAKLALATQGLAINPKQQLLFEGIDFRTYQLAFTFTPYSREEAETVRKIIKAFRKAAAPTITDAAAGMFFVPPNIITLDFLHNGKRNPNISRVAESVIESIDVNYTPTTMWAAHDDGAPVQTMMTINFKEVQLIDSDMINNGGY